MPAKPRAGDAHTLTLRLHLLAGGETVHPADMSLDWLAAELTEAGWAAVIVERDNVEPAEPEIARVLLEHAAGRPRRRASPAP